MCDLTLLLYIATAVVSTFGSLLFVGWLIRSSYRATSVYLYVTMLLVVEAIRSCINIQGRLHALDSDESFMLFSLNWIWSARMLLPFVAVLAIVAHMSYRVLTGKNPEVPEQWRDKMRNWLKLKRKSG